MHRSFEVVACYDDEAGVWYVERCDVPGLSAEAATIEELMKKLPGMILDLLGDPSGDHDGPGTVPIDLIAKAHFDAAFA